MTIQWDALQRRCDEVAQKLVNPDLPVAERRTLQKEQSHLTQLLAQNTLITTLEHDLKEAAAQLAGNNDPAMAELFREEQASLESQLAQATATLEKILFPPGEHDDRSVYLEIRAGAGGQEAALFASDLMKMYTNYGQKKGWHVSVESVSTTDLGGFREVVLAIKGEGVYGHLKYESGVHRVQRVPATETQGRIHTSTATVAVLPEAEEVDVTINPEDLRIDVYRSSGAGGQHVNTTDSAVRITHIPTGVVVACQDERSQHKNKAKAMKLLQSRILAAQVEKQQEEMSKQRKQLVGTGMRAEKVRTYNYPQNRVTDHQVEVTLKKLDRVMLGEMDEIIDALQDMDRKKRQENAAISY